MAEIIIREAVSNDAESISGLFHEVYGDDYPYKKFYDPEQIRKLIYADDTVMIVAEDPESGRIYGTASVLEERGAYSDLTAEFGRLVVHPDARGMGLGNKLMEGRVEHVKDRIHVGVVDARIVHPRSTKIAVSHDFSVVGYLPSKIVNVNRENIILLARHFGPALELRRNHPHIIPEAWQLANQSMKNCGIHPYAIVDETAPPYPAGADLTMSTMTSEGYADLLRIARGRTRHRQIFGALRLHYGVFKLQATDSHYILAKQGDVLVGAIGYTVDHVENDARIFELIALNDDVIYPLLSEFLRIAESELGSCYVDINVSAYAPRMQRTLLELGFLPAAYIPAMVFNEVERLDILKMVRIFVPLDTSQDILIPEAEPIGDIVVRSFASQTVPSRILEAINRQDIFDGLNLEQLRRLASYCTVDRFKQGDVLFSEGNESDAFYIILDGTVEEMSSGTARAHSSEGDTVASISTLAQSIHRTTSVALTDLTLITIMRNDFESLARLRPDIGTVIYRNLTRQLGEELLTLSMLNR
ncbi:MAG: GNAT family N-acetyltransferase [Candidatus Kapaibacterium sp.]